MREADVAVILALANGHDQRQGIDDVKVQAWHALFTQEAPEMTREFAVERINYHYARSTEMLMPAHLVTAWKEQSGEERLTALMSGVECPHETPGGARYCALCRVEARRSWE